MKWEFLTTAEHTKKVRKSTGRMVSGRFGVFLNMDYSKFDFKEIDTEGHQILDAISSANNLNRWMYEIIKPYCSGKILEIGSGIGNISQFFLNEGFKILLSDVRENYCNILSQKFSNRANLLGVKNIDLIHPAFEYQYKELLKQFHTVFALNVIEHIEDDFLAIANAKELLKPGGTLIILVPAFQWMYNQLDKELYHLKRYNQEILSQLFIKNNIIVADKFYFNALAMLGWFISGKILKNRIIRKSQISFYNIIVPLAKLTDALLFRRIGLSVVVIGKK